MNIEKIIEEELLFQTSKSPGHGGQNVNKRNTKVQAFFDIHHSIHLSQEEKEILLKYYPEGTISVSSHEERSQLQNKENTKNKIEEIIEKYLTPQKPRIQTDIPYHEKEKRYIDKTRQGEKKKQRSVKINLDNE